jgi:dienelactone hydrolase
MGEDGRDVGGLGPAELLRTRRERTTMVLIRVIATSSRGSAVVEDVVFTGPDGLDVEAYLVRPAASSAGDSRGPGVVMWHWLDSEAPDGNRTQYLDEAAELAAFGTVSLLPQGRFPWQFAPDNAVNDAAAVRGEVARLRAGLDLLASRPDVDPQRLGIVGHDFGGMLAAVAAADGTPLCALVIVAATPRWGDWFLPFWQIVDDRIEYLRAMRPLDPIERIGEARATSILFQFAERDFYIAPMTAREFARAAPDGSAFELYDTGHDMRLPEIRASRMAFLGRALRTDRDGSREAGAAPTT